MPKDKSGGGGRGRKAKAARPTPRNKTQNALRARKQPIWHAAYLSSLAENGVYLWAARAAGVNLSTVWRERQGNPDFAHREKEALDAATQLLEGEAVRRAQHGLRQYKFDKGEPVMDPRTGEQYFELEYSDTLLVMLLKARRPELYREKMDVEHSGKVTHQHLTLAQFEERCKEAGL